MIFPFKIIFLYRNAIINAYWRINTEDLGQRKTWRGLMFYIFLFLRFLWEFFMFILSVLVIIIIFVRDFLSPKVIASWKFDSRPPLDQLEITKFKFIFLNIFLGLFLCIFPYTNPKIMCLFMISSAIKHHTSSFLIFFFIQKIFKILFLFK